MKSFNDYSKNNTQEEMNSKSAEDLAKQISFAYNGKSNVDMMQNILKEAEKSKRAGTLSNEEIEAFYQNFSAMLNPIQRKKLRSIVDDLKNI